MTYDGIGIFAQMPAFTFDLTKLRSDELAQLHENIYHPVSGGIVEHDWKRAAEAITEIEEEEARRLGL